MLTVEDVKLLEEASGAKVVIYLELFVELELVDMANSDFDEEANLAIGGSLIVLQLRPVLLEVCSEMAVPRRLHTAESTSHHHRVQPRTAFPMIRNNAQWVICMDVE